MRSGPESDVIKMAKLISAVRDVQEFKVIVANPLGDLEGFNAALRARSLEVDQESMKKGGNCVDYNFVATESVPPGVVKVVEKAVAL